MRGRASACGMRGRASACGMRGRASACGMRGRASGIWHLIIAHLAYGILSDARCTVRLVLHALLHCLHIYFAVCDVNEFDEVLEGLCHGTRKYYVSTSSLKSATIAWHQYIRCH